MTPENFSMLNALISGGVTLLVCLINNYYQRSRFQAIVELKLEELQKHVDRHNQLVERTYRLEEQASVQEEKMKVLSRRLDTAERMVS